jgi:hypothetical protein
MFYQRILVQALLCPTRAGSCANLARVGGRNSVPAMKRRQTAAVIAGRVVVTTLHWRGGAERGFEQGTLIPRLSYRPRSCDERVTSDDSRGSADTTRGPIRFCAWERMMSCSNRGTAPSSLANASDAPVREVGHRIAPGRT